MWCYVSFVNGLDIDPVVWIFGHNIRNVWVVPSVRSYSNVSHDEPYFSIGKDPHNMDTSSLLLQIDEIKKNE